MVTAKGPNTKFVVVGFHTPGDYEEVVKNHLQKSLDRLGMWYDITQVDDRRSWLGNIAWKPRILQQKLIQHAGTDILYLDADAELLQYPLLMDNLPPEVDLAFHNLDHRTWYNKVTDRVEVFNGTIFLRNNDRVRNFVNQWLTVTEQTPKRGEHHIFEQLVRTSGLTLYGLPLEYAYITSLPSGQPPHVTVENPVVIHTQASRNYKGNKWATRMF